MLKRGRFGKFVFAVIIIAVLCLAVIVAWLAYNCSYSPFSLDGKLECIVEAPGSFKYCFVRAGTSESEIIRRFGNPEFVAQTDGQSWERFIKDEIRAEWRTPPNTIEGKVLVYRKVGKSCGVTAYYFFDDHGRLKNTYMGEYLP